jgi:formylglycine-generating enzyme required for sulfatase activity
MRQGRPGQWLVWLWLPIASLACNQVEDRSGPITPETQIITSKSGVGMVLIPGGSFAMGSRFGKDDEGPVHTIKLDAFLMDRYLVTQEQYEKLALPNPAHFKGADRPVEMIPWDKAAMYCNARSREEGLEPCYDEDTGECHYQAPGYRLPTEAEWEYACRAGKDSDYFFGNESRLAVDHAWFADNANKQTHPVGQKKPNPWGLFDMIGNVAQWCNDIYAKDYYSHSPSDNPHGPTEGDKNVLRGGAWNSSVTALRSAARVGETPGMQDACFARDAIGFRCVRRPSGEAP